MCFVIYMQATTRHLVVGCLEAHIARNGILTALVLDVWHAAYLRLGVTRR